MKIEQYLESRFWWMMLLFVFQLIIADTDAFAQKGKNLKANGSNLHTNVYVVPPTFLIEAVPIPHKLTAKDVLESAGIAFAPGSSAIYNASNHQLLVRNSKDQMDLVESYINAFDDKDEIQIHIMAKFVESPDSINQGKPLRYNQAPSKTNSVPSSEMLKVLVEEDINAVILNLSEPNIFQQKVTGVFTDPQFQLLIRKLRQQKGVDFLSEQNHMMRSGQRVIFRRGDQKVGITAVANTNKLTINLKVFSREDLQNNNEIREVILRDTPNLQDGQTIAMERKLSNGRFRIEFITARILDPSGAPIHGQVKPGTNRSAQIPKMVTSNLTTDQITDVRKADKFALAGSRLFAAGNYNGSIEKSIKSLRILPIHPITAAREKAYLEQLLQAIRK